MIPADNSIDTFDIEELLMYVLGIDPNDEDYEEKIETGLYENYGIEDPHALYQFVRQITPLVDRGTSTLSNSEFKGFAVDLPSQGDGFVRKKWLLKIPA